MSTSFSNFHFKGAFFEHHKLARWHGAAPAAAVMAVVAVVAVVAVMSMANTPNNPAVVCALKYEYENNEV